MGKYASYGSYGERLVAIGVDQFLAVEVAQQTTQRPLFVSATAITDDGLSPTPEELNGFARVLVYVGAIQYDVLTSGLFGALSRIANIQSVLGVSRILLNQLVQVNKPSVLWLPSNRSDLFATRPGETLGAVLLIPADQNGNSMNTIAHLTFYGVADESNDNPQYKVI